MKIGLQQMNSTGTGIGALVPEEVELTLDDPGDAPSRRRACHFTVPSSFYYQGLKQLDEVAAK